MPLERVQKILAQAGIASRRKAEELILEGVVTINGKIAQLGDKAELGKDAIKVQGKLIQASENPVYLAFHKPKAVISMLVDPEGRPTIAGYLKGVKERVFPIGRLDFTSEGLIFLTNDGQIAERFQKQDAVPRVYHIKVKGHPDPSVIEKLRRGAHVNGKAIQPHSVRLLRDLNKKSFIEVVVLGSGAMDLKSLLEQRGLLVERMIRHGIGHLTLEGIRPGEFRALKKSQLEAVLSQPELGLRQIEEAQEKAEEKAARRQKFEDQRGKAPRIIPRGEGKPKKSAWGKSGGPKREGFSKREGFPQKREGFSKREGFPQKREGFSKREGFPQKRAGFAKRDGFPQKREGFSPRSGRPPRGEKPRFGAKRAAPRSRGPVARIRPVKPKR